MDDWRNDRAVFRHRATFRPRSPSRNIFTVHAITVAVFSVCSYGCSSENTSKDNVLQQGVIFWDAIADSVTRVVSPRFVSETEIVFADSRDCRVVQVSQITGIQWTSGRRGSGPGEFRGPTRVAIWRPVGYVVWDTWNQTLSLLGSGGRFQMSRRLPLPMSGAPIELSPFNDSYLAIAALAVSRSHPAGRSVLVVNSRLDSVRVIEASCASEYEGLTVADMCYRTIGSGLDQTLLVAYWDDYSLKRYNIDGDLLWESSSLDSAFQPVRFVASETRPGGGISIANGLDAVLELPDQRIVVAGWRAGLADTLHSTGSFLDIRHNDGGLIERFLVPNGLRIGDLLLQGEKLLILAYYSGASQLPEIRIFELSLDRIR